MIIGLHTKIKINTEIQQTEYICGSNLLSSLHKIIENIGDYSNILLLIDKNVNNLYGRKIIKSLQYSGKQIVVSPVPSGEKYKNLNFISKFITPFFQKGISRRSCLIAVGGGVTTDLGGFIASILLRGIECVYIPTTLLGQIDAAIGGKTGVDFWMSKNKMYKNMIGTFQQPKTVISDTDFLNSLPIREIRTGIGEMIKYFIGWGRPDIKKIVNFNKILKSKINLTDLISQCQKIKIEMVLMDPLDQKNIRAKLNLGHTVGHAIESVKKDLSHGECVALGIAAAAKISLTEKILNDIEYKKILKSILDAGLPVQVKNLNIAKVLKIMDFDKKGGNFILIKNIGNLVIKSGIDQKTVISALREINL